MAITLPDDMKLDFLRDMDGGGAKPLDDSGAPADDTTTGAMLGRRAPIVTGLTSAPAEAVIESSPASAARGAEVQETAERYLGNLSTKVEEGGSALADKLVKPNGLTGEQLDDAKAAFTDGVVEDLNNLEIKEALTPEVFEKLQKDGAQIIQGKNFDLALRQDGKPNELYLAPDLSQEELAEALQEVSEIIFEVNAEEQGLTLNQEAFDEFISGFTETFFIGVELNGRLEADQTATEQDENLARIARETLMRKITIQ